MHSILPLLSLSQRFRKKLTLPSCSVVVIAFLLFSFIGGCTSSKNVADEGRSGEVGQGPAGQLDIPKTPREFRAVWVATVANIDWPSKRGLPVKQQKKELVQIMDRAASMNMNAVIFQVRPHADAMYDSRYEPWSAYLTGQMGEAPVPYYDPLEFAVEEAHKRGLELHAWFNPYRARHPSDTSKIASNHVSQVKPELVHQFGEYQWLDPGMKEVRDLSRNVIMDVVKRYDVDGVHLDDYFYPYPSYASGKEFPDSLSWQKARAKNPDLNRDDWRRSNVDRFIKEVYQSIKAEKPHVKFGISPFGTWRPGHPKGTGGFDAYSQLYADARLWLRKGWVDYFTPQIYNRIDRVIRPFPVILQWWTEQNVHDRHIWPGLYTSRSAGDRGWPTEEITGEIYIARGHPGVTGSVHFSMRSLLPEWNSLVRDMTAAPYASPALIPASPWLDDKAPGRPSAELSRYSDKMMIEMDAPAEEVRWWTVWSKTGSRWELDIIPASRHTLTFHGTRGSVWPQMIAVSAVDRNGNESAPRLLTVPELQDPTDERTASAGAGVAAAGGSFDSAQDDKKGGPAARDVSAQGDKGGGPAARDDSVLSGRSLDSLRSLGMTKRADSLGMTTELNIVEREEWGPSPGGYAANGMRRNLAEDNRLQFRDLQVELNEMISGINEATIRSLDRMVRLTGTRRLGSIDTLKSIQHLIQPDGWAAVEERRDSHPLLSATPDSARITLSRYGTAEELTIAEGEELNWHGYHIGVLAVNTDPGALAGGLTEFEVATVSSLPITRAAAKETGGASQRLRMPHNITQMTLHHSGSPKPLTAEEDPVQRLQDLYNWGREARNWWDVPYHYLIGLDGTIYEGRDPRYAGDTNTTYDTRGHLLITVMGNYDKQKPTEAQVRAISNLMSRSADKYGLSSGDISAHYELADTGCPGKHLRALYEEGTFDL